MSAATSDNVLQFKASFEDAKKKKTNGLPFLAMTKSGQRYLVHNQIGCILYLASSSDRRQFHELASDAMRFGYSTKQIESTLSSVHAGLVKYELADVLLMNPIYDCFLTPTVSGLSPVTAYLTPADNSRYVHNKGNAVYYDSTGKTTVLVASEYDKYVKEMIAFSARETDASIYQQQLVQKLSVTYEECGIFLQKALDAGVLKIKQKSPVPSAVRYALNGTYVQITDVVSLTASELIQAASLPTQACLLSEQFEEKLLANKQPVVQAATAPKEIKVSKKTSQPASDKSMSVIKLDKDTSVVTDFKNGTVFIDSTEGNCALLIKDISAAIVLKHQLSALIELAAHNS